MTDYNTDDFTHDAHIPRIEIGDIDMLKDLELELATNHDYFYRRIVSYMIEAVENRLPEGEPLAILVDENGVEYDMELPPEGYLKSLNKTMEYFTDIEEYETCSLIKDIITLVENGLQ